MKKFLDEDFLLQNRTAVKLYHEYAENMPIFDYCCHIPPKDICEDRKFESITELWLGDGAFGDCDKWHAMRQCGVEEDYVTGLKSNEEKFMKYAEVVPYTIGNPLYIRTHLELKKYFGINDLLSPKTAKSVYERANEKLKKFSARRFIEMSGVRTLCTPCDPVETLEWHIKMRNDDTMKFSVLPTFSPDKCLEIGSGEDFRSWVKQLETSVAGKIEKLADFENALEQRVKFFDSIGCVSADHELAVVEYENAERSEIEKIFVKVMKKKKLVKGDVVKYKGYILRYLARLYNKYGWTQQFHIGALRTSFKSTVKNADAGIAPIEDETFVSKLVTLLHELDESNELPKTILYCLNPRDNEVVASMINCFRHEDVAGKVQFCGGKWFNDHPYGIGSHVTALSSVALISKFIGATTNSGSLTAFTKHDFFRRIICNRLGELIENGEYPSDLEFVGMIVQDICYNNAVDYFKKD